MKYTLKRSRVDHDEAEETVDVEQDDNTNDANWYRTFGLLQALANSTAGITDLAMLDVVESELAKNLKNVQNQKQLLIKQERQRCAQNSTNNIRPTPHSVEAFRCLARSGYLTPKEFGRMFFQSSPAFAEGSMGREYLFQLLLEQRTECGILLKQQNQKQLRHISRETLFRKLYETDPKYRTRDPIVWPELPDKPTLNIHNTLFIISFWAHDKPLFSEIIPSSQFDTTRKPNSTNRFHRTSTTEKLIWKPTPKAYALLKAVVDEEDAILQTARLDKFRITSKTKQKKLANLFGSIQRKRILQMRLQVIRFDDTDDDPEDDHSYNNNNNNNTNSKSSNPPSRECKNIRICTLSDSNYAPASNPAQLFFNLKFPLRLTEKGNRLLAKCCNTTSYRIQEVGGFGFIFDSLPNRDRGEIGDGDNNNNNNNNRDAVAWGLDLRLQLLGSTGRPSAWDNGITPFHLLEELTGWK